MAKIILEKEIRKHITEETLRCMIEFCTTMSSMMDIIHINVWYVMDDTVYVYITNAESKVIRFSIKENTVTYKPF